MSFIDPNVARKNATQDAHFQRASRLPNGAPVFSHIEFSVCGLCNRTCVFCPRVDSDVYPNVPEFMSLELYRKILGDLLSIGYTGNLSYSGFSEPFYHKKIVDFVSASKDMLPECRVEIITNGDFVTADKLRALFGAGLDALLVSMYDGPEQIPHFEALAKEAGVSPDRLVLRKRYLPVEQQYGLQITNRAGMVQIEQLGVGPLPSALKQPCYYTHYRMMVDHNGDVLLCPHDWGKKLVAGNLAQDHIVEIWTNRLDAVRRQLGSGDRDFAPCNVCNVDGRHQGGAHFNAWNEFYRRQRREP